jgi:hypothetical protein
MAASLQGAELRVFRCLIKDPQSEKFDDICVEMTHAPPLERDEVAEALESLKEMGYAEEFKPAHWKYTDNGYVVRRSLLGELPPDEPPPGS